MRVVSMALIEMSYLLLSIVSVVLAWLTANWVGFAYIHALVLMALLYLAIVRIPLTLNWSSNLYGSVFGRIFLYQVFAIFTYSICYYRHAPFAAKLETFADALYFSATTWTTLGYGDISPVGAIRLLSSIQAFTGLCTLPVFASVIWLYCERRLWKKTQEERDTGGYQLTTDRAMGYFVEVESERTLEEQRRRDAIQLRTCSCEDSTPFIEKYFDIAGRLTPLARFHVVCRGCGAIGRAQLNAHLAAWAWNFGKSRTAKFRKAKPTSQTHHVPHEENR